MARREQRLTTDLSSVIMMAVLIQVHTGVCWLYDTVNLTSGLSVSEMDEAYNLFAVARCGTGAVADDDADSVDDGVGSGTGDDVADDSTVSVVGAPSSAAITSSFSTSW